MGSTNPDYDYKQDTLGFVSLAGTDKPLDSKGQRKLQILISNYRIDREYITSKKYNYKQYEIDTKSTDIDAIQKDLLRGSPGSDVGLWYYSNFKSPYPSEIAKAPGFPAGGLENQKLDYKDNKGLVLSLDVPVSFGVKSYEAKFSWLSAGGDIVTTLDDESLTTNATSPEKGTIINNKLSINRPEFKEYQVLLVEIDLS
ncbi:hypothetical protein [Pseudomonas synxantha]|uniref:hypothetical protein n=1 Tax=Pseudomonas synxantha TaxID=47883 RepID=UPI0012F79390|nr:hypothetical protein [Pseudomonas synxantha]